MQSVQAVRFLVAQIREALVEVRQSLSDPVSKVEAQALAEELGSYRFLICSVVWCDILTLVNQVNKLFQSSTMQLDSASNLITSTKAALSQYRASGFAAAQATAKDLCEKMNLEAVLKQKRLRNTRKQFSYEAADKPLTDALRNLEVTFFNTVVDVALHSFEEVFQTMENVRDTFGILLNFNDVATMSRGTVKKHCEDIEKALRKTPQPSTFTIKKHSPGASEISSPEATAGDISKPLDCSLNCSYPASNRSSCREKFLKTEACKKLPLLHNDSGTA